MVRARRRIQEPIGVIRDPERLGGQLLEGEEPIQPPKEPPEVEPTLTRAQDVEEFAPLVSSLRNLYPDMFNPDNSFGFSEEEIPLMVIQQISSFAEEDPEGFVRDLLSKSNDADSAIILKALGVDDTGVADILSISLPERKESVIEPPPVPLERVFVEIDNIRQAVVRTEDNSLYDKRGNWVGYYNWADDTVFNPYKAEGLGQKAINSLMAGIGDVLSVSSGVALRFGYDDAASKLSTTGSQLQQYGVPSTSGDFQISDLLNPEFYATKITRTIPFALSLAPLAIGGYYTGAGLATVAGLGTVWTAIVGGVTGGILSRPLESALEAGGSYNDAIARGKTGKEAEEEFDEVFRNNMTLAGADAFQIAIALAPTPKWVPTSLVNSGLVRTARIGSKMFIIGLSEGGEEVYQDMIQRHARGEEWKLDAVSKEVFAIGAVMGLGMGLGGDIVQGIVNRSKEKMSTTQKQQFANDVDRFKEAGFNPSEAELRALEQITKTDEAIVRESVREVKPTIEPTIAPIESVVAPEVTAEEITAIPKEGKIIPEVGKPPVTPTPEAPAPAEVVEPVEGVVLKVDEKISIAPVKEVELPTAINKIRAEHDQVRNDVEAIRASLRGKTDIGSRLTKQVLVGTERELAIAGRILSRVETQEELASERITNLQERLGASVKLANAKVENIQGFKQALVDFVNTLPLDVRGKMLASVKNVRTEQGLENAANRAIDLAEQSNQKVLRVEIRKEIKTTKAVVRDKVLKGTFTPEVQRNLNVLANNLEADRNVVRTKIAENIQKYTDGELSYEETLEANEALNFAGIDGMSSEELANTLEYIKILKIVGRSERQAKQQSATERITATRSGISNILTGGQGLKTGVGAVPRRLLESDKRIFDAFVNWQYSLDDIADKLSKLDPTSLPFQSELSKFVAKAHRATTRQTVGTQETYKKFTDIIKEVYGVKSNHDANQVLNSLDVEVSLGTFQFTPEYIERNWTPEMIANNPGLVTFDLKMTRDEMISKFMQMQDTTLNDTFTIGMGWSQQVKNAVESNLTVEEKQLADAIFEFYEDYYTDVNKIYQELYNVDMPHNPRYSPIRRDLEGTIQEDVLTFQDATQYASTLNDSLKARTRNIRPLKFNGATSILSNHIDQMEHFKAWATTMRDFRRVFGSPGIRQAIEQYHGRGIERILDRFMNQLARDGVETAATNRVADTLRRNFTKSILAIKPVVGLKQIPSLFAYMSDQQMGTTGFFSGIADFWKSPIANFKFLRENSEGFRARVSQGFERDIRAALAKHGRNRMSGRGSFTDWFLLQIRVADTFAVTQGMWAKYQSGLKVGLSQQEAIAEAEDLTNRTQPSFGIDTLSALQNSGSWFKLMTMFQNQPNKYFRLIGDNLRNFKYDRGSRTKAASTIVLTWVILPMMFQFIADAFQFKPERQLRAGLLGPLNFILIGGQLVQAAWGWVTDQPFDYNISPVLSSVDEVQKAFLRVRRLINQGIDPYKDITFEDVAPLVEYLAKAGGQLAGLPTPYFVQVEKQIRRKLAEGKDINIKDFLFSGWSLIPPTKNAEEKVEDLNLLLGEPEEEAEDKPLTDKPLKIYDTADWFRDIGKAFKNVLPQDVLDNPEASKESKAWAQYEVARSKADILPNTSLYKINTEEGDDNILNYYEQW